MKNNRIIPIAALSLMLASSCCQQPEVKNVIYVIGDGMGLGAVSSLVLTEDGQRVVLSDCVYVVKEEKNIIIDSHKIKTEFFYSEYLQDEDKYDTIISNDVRHVFSFRDNNPYTVTVITTGGEKDG